MPTPEGARVLCYTAKPRPGEDLGGAPPLAGQRSRLRGCTGLRVTGGGVTMMMRTLILSGCVSPGGKRGRNEVCNLVVVGLFYWNIREHPLPVDRHGDRAGAGAADCGVRIAGWPGPFQGWLADTIWRHMVKSNFSFHSHHRWISFSAYLLFIPIDKAQSIFAFAYFYNILQCGGLIGATPPAARHGVHNMNHIQLNPVSNFTFTNIWNSQYWLVIPICKMKSNVLPNISIFTPPFISLVDYFLIFFFLKTLPTSKDDLNLPSNVYSRVVIGRPWCNAPW